MIIINKQNDIECVEGRVAKQSSKHMVQGDVDLIDPHNNHSFRYE